MRRVLFLFFWCIALGGFSTRGQNLVANGSFENDFSGWTNLTGEVIWGREPATVAAAPDARAAFPEVRAGSAGLNAYPNPARTGKFTVEIGSADVAQKPVLQMLNAEGKEVVRQVMGDACTRTVSR